MDQENLIRVPDKIFGWPYAKNEVSSSMYRVHPTKKSIFSMKMLFLLLSKIQSMKIKYIITHHSRPVQPRRNQLVPLGKEYI